MSLMFPANCNGSRNLKALFVAVNPGSGSVAINRVSHRLKPRRREARAIYFLREIVHKSAPSIEIRIGKSQSLGYGNMLLCTSRFGNQWQANLDRQPTT